jgi:hypothetical protein
MKLSEAGLQSNLDYWKRVADRYRLQRDDALKEVCRMQKELLVATGKARDGKDYLREILATGQKATFKQRFKNLMKGFV